MNLCPFCQLCPVEKDLNKNVKLFVLILFFWCYLEHLKVSCQSAQLITHMVAVYQFQWYCYQCH